jgi:Ca2+-binding EF-hand superfamily protein
LRRAGKDVSEDELRAMLIDVDADGNVCVDFAEFLSLFAARMAMADNDAEAELLADITWLDVAGDGRVSIAEMRGFLIHDQGCEQELDEIFADVAAGLRSEMA